MLKLQFLILSLSLTLSISNRCSIFRCTTTPFLDNQCAYHDTIQGDDVYEVKQCPQTFHCNYYNENKTTFCSPPISKKYPGDQCTSNSDCATNLCDNNICQGKKEGDDCDYHDKCSIGLTCINKVCQPQRKEGEECGVDQNCQNDYGCTIYGKCVKYFSLKLGEWGVNPLLCETMTMDVDGYCAETKLQQETLECGEEQEDCEYEVYDGKMKFTQKEKCQCTRGNNDKRYCHYGSKSEMSDELINLIKDVFWRNRKLHTMNRFRIDSYETERRINFLNQYPMYVDADECSIDVDLDNHKTNKLLYFLQ